jgi:FkbM family methyltransferase
MRLDYIEIGTSDFGTLVETLNGNGISIEPLSFYLNKLPNKENNTKLNAAVSDKEGEEIIYYVSPDDISRYNLPDWIKGCNSIKSPHPSVVNVLNETNLTHLYKKELIKVITWDNIIREHNVISVDFLKIDTEGHDTVILNSILDSKLNILPNKILFESNILSKREDIDNILLRLKDKGYVIKEEYDDGILVEMSTRLPNKIIFSSNDSRYLKYWRDNSKLCSELLRITPVLLHITNEDSDFFWDEFGLVKKIKCDDDTSLLSQVVRLYSGIFFPNEKIMISDIDMFLFNKKVLTKNLVGSDYYDVTIIGSDAYDKNRPECYDYPINCKERFPMCYVITTGNTLNQIMGIEEGDTFNDFLIKNNFNDGFNSDEIVFSNNLIKSNLKINRVNRGYISNYHLKERIEKYMFSEDKYFKINLKELKDLDGYDEFHCPDYDTYRETIKHLLSLSYKQ